MKNNKYEINKRFILIFLIGILFFEVDATDFEKKILSPEVASRYTDFERPVSEATGTLGISIPIYTCKTQNITVPISLYFNTSGIKHMQKASSVGLGWGLNAGGFITRVVKVYNFEINGHTSRAFCKGYLL